MSNNGQMPNGYGQVSGMPGVSQPMMPQQYAGQMNGHQNPSMAQMNPATMQQMQMQMAVAAAQQQQQQQHQLQQSSQQPPILLQMTPQQQQQFAQMTPQQQQQVQLQMQQQLMSSQMQQPGAPPMQLSQSQNAYNQLQHQQIPLQQQHQSVPIQSQQSSTRQNSTPGLSPANIPTHPGQHQQQNGTMVHSPASNRPTPSQPHISKSQSVSSSIPSTPTHPSIQKTVQQNVPQKSSQSPGLHADQQASSQPAPSEINVPAPLTREQYQLMLLRWNALKTQGKTEATDLEFAAISKIIKQAGVEQKKYKARLAEVNNIKAARSKSKSKSKTNDTRDTKVKALNAQIKAFQLLSHNLDVPSNIQNLLVEMSNDKKDQQKDQPANKVFTQSPLDISNFSERLLRASVSPSNISASSSKAKKESIGNAKEKIISNKITQRIIELERLPGNLGTVDLKSVDLDPSYNIPQNDDELKVKALIELKALRQLTKQKSMRQHVVFDLATVSDPVAASMNLRYTHKRPKPQSLQDLKATEKLEYQQRMERERKERLKHIALVKGICSQAQQVLVEKHTKTQRHVGLGRAIVASHNQIEKEEQKRAERTAKQRLQALKSNDEEAYIKLLDQTKDTRITHLLRQTNSFLDSLAQRVKVQQRESSFTSRKPGKYADGEEDEERVDYYEIAHRIKEEVTIQPSILVGGKLKEYQLKGLQWMVSLFNNNLNGILADEMGLGKTIQSISLITYLIEVKRQPGPYLVIVPLSTLTNWTLEFEKWAPSVKKIVYKGPPQVRRYHQNEIRTGDFQVLLTTYEYIIKDRPLLGKIRWTHMIIDEGHRMKNASSKLSCTINQYYTSSHRLILTGTPLQNNLIELWALLNFVLPKIFNSVKTFDEWFNTPFANAGGQDKMELNEEETLLVIRRLHKVLRPFLLRRLKKDVEKDLPDKVEKVIKCKMSAVQSKLYQQVVLHNVIFVGEQGSKSGVRGLNNRIMQLRKICNHPFVFEETENMINPTHQNNDSLWRVAGKFELLDRILPKFKATGHRVLIFFQMTQVMDIMEDYLRFRDIKYLRLDGGTKADERSEMLKVFNAPNSPYFAFLLSTRAGGLGLNLQTADTVIIYDTDWNPHQDLQAQDRAHRIGQTKEVRILRLITEDSVEESILSRAHSKLEIDGKVIQAGKFDQKSTAEEQEAFLRSLLEAEEARRNQKPEEDEIDDDELNEILARTEEEQVIFRQIDEERQKTSLYGRDKKHERLFSEQELPEDLKQDIAQKLEENRKPSDEVLGRGARKRERIYYDDGLTEEQWLEAMDDDNDSVENAVARKRARFERRQKRKLEKLGFDPENDNGEDEDDRASVEAEELLPEDPNAGKRKRRGRKPKALIEEERAALLLSNGSLDPVSTPVVPVKKKGRRGRKSKAQIEAEAAAAAARENGDYDSNDSDTDILSRKKLSHSVAVSPANLVKLGTELVESILVSEDTDGRTRADLFMELPDREEYDDYYQLITKPIAIDIIQDKLNNQKYNTLKDVQKDFLLMSSNAMQYNEVGSLVYEDAEEIARLTKQWYLSALEKAANLEKPPLSHEANNGSSTLDPATNTDTPASAPIVPATPAVPPKKRGRPAKSVTDADSSETVSLSPNNTNDKPEEANGHDPNHEQVAANPKGRPRKHNTISDDEEDENEYSDTATAGNGDNDEDDNDSLADSSQSSKKRGNSKKGPGRRKKA